MVNFKPIFLSFLFFSFFSYADLFSSEFSQPPDDVSSRAVSCGANGRISFQACAEALCEPRFEGLRTGNANDSIYLSYAFEASWRWHISSNPAYFETAIIPICEHKFKTWGGSEIGFRNEQQARTELGIKGVIIVELEVCPPQPPHQDFIYTHVDPITDQKTCFEPVDLAYRDSCPDSTQDGDYVLPVSETNSSDSICQSKSDGSMCKYNLVDNVYVTDFENNCYSSPSIPTFDDLGLIQPDPTNQDCQDIGNGITACVENPDNVCDSNGGCNSGCGSIGIGDADPVFVCLSGDSDGDGLGDYYDPDIDGDGIANELDLDSDGDGKDDRKYPKKSESQTVSLDTDKLESQGAESNATLSEIKGLLEEQNGSGKLPEYSSIAEETTFNDSIMSRLTNAPVMVAMSSISGAINFNTEGSCPVLSFYLPVPIDKTVSTSTHCEIMPMISVIITPVMFAIYLFMGFRIFGSA
jgi:hypothetical protein